MEIKKYHGHIKNRFLMLLSTVIFLSFFSVFLSTQSGDYRLLLFAGIMPIMVITALIISSLLVDIYILDHSRIDDMILINEKGISLKCLKSQSKSILWGDVIKIEKIRSRNLSPRIFVTSVNGEEIWWYSANKKAEIYILGHHPELASVFAER